MKSSYKYLHKNWKQGIKSRVVKWRTQRTVERVDKPTRIDRARSLGYKAKKGFVIARVRIKKGGRTRPTYSRGRKPRKAGLTGFTPGKSKRWIAEEKAARRFKNLEVLNSYYAAEDGQYQYYEVILVDPNNPNIKNDANINWICNAVNRKRVFRGKTSSGQKSKD